MKANGIRKIREKLKAYKFNKMSKHSFYPSVCKGSVIIYGYSHSHALDRYLKRKGWDTLCNSWSDRPCESSITFAKWRVEAHDHIVKSKKVIYYN